MTAYSALWFIFYEQEFCFSHVKKQTQKKYRSIKSGMSNRKTQQSIIKTQPKTQLLVKRYATERNAAQRYALVAQNLRQVV